MSISRERARQAQAIRLALTYCPELRQDLLICAALESEEACEYLNEAHELVHKAIECLIGDGSEASDEAFGAGSKEIAEVRKAWEELIEQATSEGF